jgi:L-amino acid N-acyltransferase YncA
MPHFSGWGTQPRAVGLEVRSRIRAAVVYTNYSVGNVFASIAIDGRMNRQFLHAIFYNPFIAWGVRHITCTIEDENVKSLKLCKHLGFKQCGRLRQAAFNGGDIIIMGMLESECRYLK